MMLERLVRLKPYFALMQVTHDLKCNLSDEDWKVIEELTVVIKPFMLVQLLLEGEKYVTISFIPYLISEIRIGLNDVLSNNGAHPQVVDLVSQMLTNFNDRWGDGSSGSVVEENSTRTKGNRQKGLPILIIVAAALDPRFKSLCGVPDAEHENVWKHVERECGLLDINNNVLTGAPIVPAVLPEQATPTGLFARLQQQNKALTPQQEHDQASIIREEVAHYRSAKPLDILDDDNNHHNPLVWWKNNDKAYPHLAVLARRILCIPATSASSERVFSTAGATVTNERSRLAPENVANCVFLHDTWPVLEVFGVMQ